MTPAAAIHEETCDFKGCTEPATKAETISTSYQEHPGASMSTWTETSYRCDAHAQPPADYDCDDDDYHGSDSDY